MLSYLAFVPQARSQYNDLTTPVTSTSPTGTVTDRDRQMMEVRRAAGEVQAEAAAASMARSADRSIDQQNTDRAVQEARELKALKRDAADRLRWERSNARVRKVSANDMSSWETQSGNVRVQQDVPDAFIASLIAEEEEAMRRGTIKKEKKRFSPANLNPFRKKDPQPISTSGSIATPVAATASDLPAAEEDDGFFRGMKLPRIGIPGIGNRNDEVEEIPDAPTFANTSSSNAPVVSASGAAASSAPVNRTVPQMSGAALVDGGAPPAIPASAASSDGSSPQLASFSPAPVEPEKERGGLFSGFRKTEPQPQSASSQLPDEGKKRGGLFAFGRKKDTPGTGDIDASLFPSESVAAEPTGAQLSGSYTASDVAQDMASAPSSTGTVALPGEREKKGFALQMPELKMPNISMPSLAGSGSGSGNRGNSSVPTLTTINSAGTDYYVTNATAQFMVYGDEETGSEIRALAAGNVVRMTKPGEKWASIRLSDGTEGLIENKFLRAASSAEASPSFSASN